MSQSQITYHTTNVEFQVWDPDGKVLVEAHRLHDGHHQCQTPEETQWRLTPRFHHQFGSNWESHQPAGHDVVKGEDNARRAANELAAIVEDSNQTLEAVIRVHGDKAAEFNG